MVESKERNVLDMTTNVQKIAAKICAEIESICGVHKSTDLEAEASTGIIAGVSLWLAGTSLANQGKDTFAARCGEMLAELTTEMYIDLQREATK